MSLIQNALQRHQQVIEKERTGQGHDYAKWRARYVELILSGDDSPDAQRELSDILFFLEAPEDGSPPLTPNDVLADERAIQQARQLTGLLADTQEALRERSEQNARYRASERLGQETTRYIRRAAGDSDEYRNRCDRALPEMHRLAERHPHLFGIDEGGTPQLIGADRDELAAKARQSRRRESVYYRLGQCRDALTEVNEILATMAIDHERRPFFEIWAAEREREHAELLDDLKAVGGTIAGYEEWSLANPHDYRQLNPRPAGWKRQSQQRSPQQSARRSSEEYGFSDQQAAAELGLDVAEFRRLAAQPGCPAREERGWLISAIRQWIRAGKPASDSVPNADVKTGDDQQAADEQQSAAEFANNEGQAVAALGLTDDEWKLLKEQDGFPKRTSKGWDLCLIRLWMELDDAKDPAAGDDAAAG